MMIAGKDYVWLCVGDRCWGKALTEDEAVQLAQRSKWKQGRTGFLRTYNLYLCDKSTTVNECGDINWWKGKGRKNLILLKRVVNGVVQTPPTEDAFKSNGVN